MTENTNELATAEESRLGRRLLAWTRFMAVVPVLGLLVGAVTLVVVAAAEAWHLVAYQLQHGVEGKKAVVGFIEVADTFLLGIVLYVIALGIFELFVDDRLPLPHWLEFHNLDDLKQKLVGVVVVVLAVFFLGRAIEGSVDYQQLMYLGIGIAAVVLSVGYFIGTTRHEK